MGKTEIVAAVAEKLQLKKSDVEKVFDGVFFEISSALKSGNDVRVAGMGTFTVSQRKQRQGRNPRTGEEITIPASKNVTLRASKDLKESLNGTSKEKDKAKK